MNYQFFPLDFTRVSIEEMIEKSQQFFDVMSTRRTVREFSTDPLPMEVISNAIKTAGTAPSGANLQPWHFVVVTDEKIRHKIRVEAEIRENDFYTHRAPEEWLKALEPIGTSQDKHFLDSAPCHIAVFQKKSVLDYAGNKQKTYYPTESVGLATGMLISALHYAGIATLTYTPSPMDFLNGILQRPKTDKPYMLVVCGYPAVDAKVPDISKKGLKEIADFV